MPHLEAWALGARGRSPTAPVGLGCRGVGRLVAACTGPLQGAGLRQGLTGLPPATPAAAQTSRSDSLSQPTDLGQSSLDTFSSGSPGLLAGLSSDESNLSTPDPRRSSSGPIRRSYERGLPLPPMSIHRCAALPSPAPRRSPAPKALSVALTTGVLRGAGCPGWASHPVVPTESWVACSTPSELAEASEEQPATGHATPEPLESARDQPAPLPAPPTAAARRQESPQRLARLVQSYQAGLQRAKEKLRTLCRTADGSRERKVPGVRCAGALAALVRRLPACTSYVASELACASLAVPGGRRAEGTECSGWLQEHGKEGRPWRQRRIACGRLRPGPASAHAALCHVGQAPPKGHSH